MRAVHLPGLSDAQEPLFSFPTQPPPATALQYTTAVVPQPQSLFKLRQTIYLLRVHATALTRQELTWEETLLPTRFTKEYGPIPGHDVVATIAQVHKSSDAPSPAFKVGDKVLALLAFDRNGAAAEYTFAAEEELALPPSSLSASDEELATIPLSGLSAWQSLFEYGGLSKPTPTLTSSEDRAKRPVILVTGASGTVGVMVVQLGKAAGCKVIATCSTDNVEFVRNSGADVVIDYSIYASVIDALLQTEAASDIEVVMDTVGGATLYSLYSLAVGESDPANKPFAANVRFISVGCPLAALISMSVCSKEDLELLKSAARRRDVKFTFFVVRPDGAQLSQILDLMTENIIRGFVRSVFDLEKGREAMELVEGKGGKGKVILKVS